MKLMNLVEKGYKLFEHYAISDSLDVCKVCCISDEEEKMLTKTPLKQLNEDILQTYINSATCHSVKESLEMCYFLPRVLELLSENIFSTMCIDTLFDRLFSKNGECPLSENENEFLLEFLLDYWMKFIQNYPQNENIESILVMIGRHFDILPFLDNWKENHSKATILHFTDLILEWDKYETLGMFSTVKLNAEVENWLKSDKTYHSFSDSIINLYFAETNDETKITLESAQVLYYLLVK